MKVFVFFMVLSAVTGLKYGSHLDTSSDFGSSLPILGNSNPSNNGFVDGINFENPTVTIQETVDSFTTITVTAYNSVPVTLTDFTKVTVTLPTREVVRTAVDDIVRVSTRGVTRPVTQTVTDVTSLYKCSTEVSTELFTITHVNHRILQTTVTSTLIKTHTFYPTIVKTVILTETEVSTETESFTRTVWVPSHFPTRNYY